MIKNRSNLIWIDLEMTGLDPEKNKIIEIATLITDVNLKILAEGPNLAIYQTEKQLSMMDSWNVHTHTANGLLSLVRKSKVNEFIAEQETIKFLKNWIEYGKSPICGNSISQDRRFLLHYMPKLENYFHYRNIDVSSLKELVCRWKPKILDGLKKKNTHRALNDIRESIEELNYYKKFFINLDT